MAATKTRRACRLRKQTSPQLLLHELHEHDTLQHNSRRGCLSPALLEATIEQLKGQLSEALQRLCLVWVALWFVACWCV